MKIFVSSTYTDLQQHRRILIDTLLQMGGSIEVLAMEYFGSDPQNPVELSRSKVLQADVYLGIFGWRYGSIDSKTKMSVTEIEYRTALAMGIPVFIYVSSDDYAIRPDAVDVGSKANKIRRFRRELLDSHTAQKFTTPEDLSRKIATDLYRLRKEPAQQKTVDKKDVIPFDVPIDETINPCHPYIFCHMAKPSRFTGFYNVQLFIDNYNDEIEKKEQYIASFKAIDKVVYQLHETFVLPVVPMQNWRQNFLLELHVWGEFWARANIVFRDPKLPTLRLDRYVNLKYPSILTQVEYQYRSET